MRCHYCGMETEGNLKYCSWCGTRIPEQVQEEPPVTREADRWGENWLEEMEKPVQQARNEQKEPPEQTQQPEAAAPKAPAVQRRPAVVAPRLQLPVKRGLGKMFFLGLLTLGIYPTVIWSRIVTELNIAASRADGKRTMPYFAMCTLAPFTLFIYPLVWMHKFCNRIGDELKRRRIDYQFSAATFWLWNVLGTLIIVGPFIFTHKLMKSMNRINESFNKRG